MRRERRAKQEAEEALNFHRMVLAEREWRANSVALAEQLLDDCPPALRHWEWRYQKRLCHQDLLTLQPPAMQVTALALSPDGKRVALVGAGLVIKVWDVHSGQEVRSINLRVDSVRAVGSVTRPGAATVFRGSAAFSPDGNRLALAGTDNAARLWDLRNGQEILALSELKSAGVADRSGAAFLPPQRLQPRRESVRPAPCQAG